MINGLQILSQINLTDLIIGFAAILIVFEGMVQFRDWAVDRFGITTRKKESEQAHYEQMDRFNTVLASVNDHLTILDNKVSELAEKQREMSARQEEIVKEQNETKKNELRDRLLQAYRYYDKKGSWNEMEKDAFWKLFGEYDKRDGNGYIHKEVKPRMEKLKVVSLDDELIKEK
jgi:hypothetical protein